MTERAAAAQLHLCEDTVKYHKRNLFRIFSAPCLSLIHIYKSAVRCSVESGIKRMKKYLRENF